MGRLDPVAGFEPNWQHVTVGVRALAVGVLLTAWSGTTARAEPIEIEPAPGVDRPWVCLIGRADCVTVVLAELSVAGKLRGRMAGGGGTTMASFEAGVLGTSTGGRHALGLSFGLRGDGVGLSPIGRVRYRWWLAEAAAVDASVGALAGERSGASFQLGFTVMDQFGATVDLDVVSRDGTTRAEPVIGVRFGSIVAIPVTLLLVAIYSAAGE